MKPSTSHRTSGRFGSREVSKSPLIVAFVLVIAASVSVSQSAPAADASEESNEVSPRVERDVKDAYALLEDEVPSGRYNAKSDSDPLHKFLNQFVLIRVPDGYILGRNQRSSSNDARQRRLPLGEHNFQLRVRKKQFPSPESNFQLRVRKPFPSAERNFQLRVRKSDQSAMRVRKPFPTAEHNFQLRVRKDLPYAAENNFQLRVRRPFNSAEDNFQLRVRKPFPSAEQNFQLRVRKNDRSFTNPALQAFLNRFSLMRTQDGDYILQDAPKMDGDEVEGLMGDQE